MKESVSEMGVRGGVDEVHLGSLDVVSFAWGGMVLCIGNGESAMYFLQSI